MKTPRQTSPLALMQEEFRDEPWKLLVGCIMLNKASAKVARPVWEKFFEVWPTPEDLYNDQNNLTTGGHSIAKMIDILKPLGFQNVRSDRIWKMTLDFLELKPHVYNDIDVEDLGGVGKYAADSFNMFCRQEIVENVEDKELKKYVEWAKSL